jgi:hypothetical protein
MTDREFILNVTPTVISVCAGGRPFYDFDRPSTVLDIETALEPDFDSLMLCSTLWKSRT